MNEDIKPMSTEQILYQHDIKLIELEKRLSQLEDILNREQTLKNK